jgi:hypothetical protein
VPFPVPLLPPVTVIQLSTAAAVHAQPLPAGFLRRPMGDVRVAEMRCRKYSMPDFGIQRHRTRPDINGQASWQRCPHSEMDAFFLDKEQRICGRSIDHYAGGTPMLPERRTVPNFDSRFPLQHFIGAGVPERRSIC